jgi:hypothetical protein
MLARARTALAAVWHALGSGYPRRMRGSRPLRALLAAIVVLAVALGAGCGGGGDGESSDETAAVRSVKPEAQERAESMLLQVSDLPPGWRASVTSTAGCCASSGSHPRSPAAKPSTAPGSVVRAGSSNAPSPGCTPSNGSSSDRRAEIHEAFLAPGCCLVCFRRLERSF